MAMLVETAPSFNPDFALLIPLPDDFRPEPAYYALTSADDAFLLGFTLGLDREIADAPGHFSADDARMFSAGYVAGVAEWERRLDEMYADRVADGEIVESDLYPAGATS